ncbi:uncharacterized protein TNIN_210322 [Trichonephila inaurata madagascariensis]|uniref:OB domain-containing protein n=1 Tax=Trichonephila inaurata madagascariensis TaxID=2747483 RepID=A0A8X6IHT7_9ARAC|nr:uncharacterized protein TNIN_210322 [Trichonephila inaurata madagascariensis]
MASVSASYKKLFICDVLREVDEQPSKSELASSSTISKTILKAQITGVITGIKRFQQRTVYTVDDGTGALDCILWKNEPALQDKILELKKDVKFGNDALPVDLKNCALSLLKKAEASTIIDEELYVHGDTIWCLGNVNIFRGNPKLDIQHHHILYLKKNPQILCSISIQILFSSNRI